MGLVNRLTDPGGALDGARALAAQLAAFPQVCLRSDRLSAYGQWDLDVPEALARETAAGIATLGSDEVFEGVGRFASGAGRHGDFAGE